MHNPVPQFSFNYAQTHQDKTVLIRVCEMGPSVIITIAMLINISTPERTPRDPCRTHARGAGRLQVQSVS